MVNDHDGHFAVTAIPPIRRVIKTRFNSIASSCPARRMTSCHARSLWTRPVLHETFADDEQLSRQRRAQRSREQKQQRGVGLAVSQRLSWIARKREHQQPERLI